MMIVKNIVKHVTLSLIIVSGCIMQSCRNKPVDNNDNASMEEAYEESLVTSNTKGVRLISSNGVVKVPESVAVDSRNNILYVSNINGMPDEKDSSGFITRVMLSGEILDTLNIPYLNAPKGMAVLGSMLYVADIDRVIEYDIDRGNVAKIYQPEGAQFLNDITVDAENNIYVSDTKAGRIYKIANQTIVPYLTDSLCVGANGMCRADANIAMGAAERIMVVNPLNSRSKVFAKLDFTPDGLKYHNDTTFIASDFVGNIFAVTPKRCTKLVSAREGVNAADFEYLPEQNILIVPTFFNNTIDIYEIGLD